MGIELKVSGETAHDIMAHLRDIADVVLRESVPRQGVARPVDPPPSEDTTPEPAQEKRPVGRPRKMGPKPMILTAEEAEENARAATTEELVAKVLPGEDAATIAANIEAEAKAKVEYAGHPRGSEQAGRAALNDLLLARGKSDEAIATVHPHAVSVLAKFNARKFGEVKAEDYPAFIDACVEKIEELGNVG